MLPMKKKKEYPRKRKRFIKKIIYFSMFFSIIIIVACGVAGYFIVRKLEAPLFISPLPKTQIGNTDQQEKTYTELHNGLTDDQIKFTAIERANDAYIVTLQNGGQVTFSTQKDIMTQIASLQYILSHLTMEGRQFSTLDLRFKQPIIVLKP
jgi:hypothetical protein